MATIAVARTGRQASGSFAIDGSKHSFAHSLACASIAQSGIMNSVPNIEDSRALIDVLKFIFGVVEFDPERKLLSFSHPIKPENVVVGAELASRSRNILCLLPALLARADYVVLRGVPSGCQLGQRPIDWYLATLRDFGVDISFARGDIKMAWPNKTAARVRFEYPTMTGTVIAIAAAAIAGGSSQIFGASVEPSCDDQLACLRALGCTVSGNLPNITVTSGRSYNRVELNVSGDRIHAATMITAAMLSRGEIEITSMAPLRIPRFASFLKEIGIEVADGGTTLFAKYPSNNKSLSPTNVVAGSEPLFSSDWAPFAALLLATRSTGISTVSDNVFLKRFQFVDAIDNNGLDVKTICSMKDGRETVVATINGRPDKALPGGRCRPCDDIRGSAALVLSAIVSSVPVKIDDDFHLTRGYQNLPADLERIGVAEVLI